MKSGAQVYDRTTSIGYSHSKRGITVATDSGWTIKSKAIVFASGYETREFLPKNIVRFKSTYALISEPLDDLSWWKDRSLIWGTGDPYVYMRTTRDGRVLVGGKDDNVLKPQNRDRQIGKKSDELIHSFHTVFPRRVIEPAFAWAGAFGSTKDGLAYIGKHPSFPKTYFALGFGGNGITFSQIAARIVTDLFVGRRNQDAAVFSFER